MEKFPVSYPIISQNIGFIYFANAQYRSSKRLLSQFITHNAHDVYSTQSFYIERLAVIYRLGVSLFKTGELEKAKSLLNDAYLMAKDFEGEDDSPTRQIHQRLKEVSRRLQIHAQHYTTAVTARRGGKLRNQERAYNGYVGEPSPQPTKPLITLSRT